MLNYSLKSVLHEKKQKGVSLLQINLYNINDSQSFIIFYRDKFMFGQVTDIGDAELPFIMKCCLIYVLSLFIYFT